MVKDKNRILIINKFLKTPPIIKIVNATDKTLFLCGY
jgi:hypothetical protein